jgi:hypothetical protein
MDKRTNIQSIELGDGSFYPSTQLQYRRLLYYYILYCYMFRSYDHHQGKYINDQGFSTDNGSVLTLRRWIKTPIT